MSDKVTNDICRFCEKPRKSGSAVASLLDPKQAPVLPDESIAANSCICDYLLIPTANETAQPGMVLMCARCRKRLNQGARHGSMTQWVFRHDLCDCEEPIIRSAPENFDRILVQPLPEPIDLTFDEEELELDPVKFPTDIFKPLKEIARGAYGHVYKCRNRLLGTLVAVKTLRVQTPELLIELQKEAKTASILSHRNVLKVLDFGLTVGGYPFMVMEYVEGITLAERLEAGRLSIQQALYITLGICDGLSHAHQKGVFHRDVNTRNILIADPDSNAPAIKLIEFGIALSQLQDQTPSGQGKTIVGSPLYMSPDQIAGEPYDATSEVYSVGCVLFEMLTGKPPFEGKTAMEVFAQHADSQPPKLSDTISDTIIPAQLERIVSVCLAKDRAARYTSIDELRFSIEPLFFDISKRAGSASDTFSAKENASRVNKQTKVRTPVLVTAVLLVLLLATSMVAYPFLLGDAAARAAAGLGPAAQERLAGLGNAYAKTALGERYLSGNGVKPNAKKAFNYLQQASDEGLPRAQAMLGYCYLKGKGVKLNVEKAIELIDLAGTHSDALAERYMGLISLEGVGRQRDTEAAAEWFAKALEHGDINSANWLAVLIYNKLESQNENRAKAFELFQKAAQAGSKDAQFNLALCYERGLGVEENKEKAAEWYRNAKDDPMAQYRLGHLYESGFISRTDSVQTNNAKAFALYKKAAKKGNFDAQLAMSRCLNNGIGVNKEPLDATFWYDKAIEQMRELSKKRSVTSKGRFRRARSAGGGGGGNGWGWPGGGGMTGGGITGSGNSNSSGSPDSSTLSDSSSTARSKRSFDWHDPTESKSRLAPPSFRPTVGNGWWQLDSWRSSNRGRWGRHGRRGNDGGGRNSRDNSDGTGNGKVPGWQHRQVFQEQSDSSWWQQGSSGSSENQSWESTGPIADDDLIQLSEFKGDDMEKLKMHSPKLVGPGFKYIEKLPIEVLEVNSLNLADEALEHIAKLEALDELNIKWTKKITDAGVKELLKCKELDKLEIIAPATTDKALEYLSRIKRLQRLSLFTSRGTTKLKLISELPNLQTVALVVNDLDESLVRQMALIDPGRFGLFLWSDKAIDDKQVALLNHLTQRIDILGIYGTKITDQGLDSISGMHNIRFVSMLVPGVTQNGVQRFREGAKRMVFDLSDWTDIAKRNGDQLLQIMGDAPALPGS